MNHKDCNLENRRQFGSNPQYGKTIDGYFCKTHKVLTCQCGKEWGDHTFSKSQEYVRENRKDKCVDCGKELTPSDSRYLAEGNFCQSCSAAANIRAMAHVRNDPQEE